ncbi:MAG: adhesin, partial [Methanobrevibacter sp.]|nr:adhesin [Methanobrevibacter sp.]
MKIKFTIIDYIIIILVICAVVFAFIHITSDDSSKIQKTAFDASTVNKIYDTYSNYYKDGYIVKATVNGYNATNGEQVTLNGTVEWISTSGGNNVKILFDSNNETYLTGLYQNVPRADIYLDKISLENDGSKYDNLVEITAKAKEIKSLADLTNNLSGNYEITT